MSLPVVKTYVLHPNLASTINGAPNTPGMLASPPFLTVTIISNPITTGGVYHRIMVAPFSLSEAVSTAAVRCFYNLPSDLKRFISGTATVVDTGPYADTILTVTPMPIVSIDGVDQTALVPGFFVYTLPAAIGRVVRTMGCSFDVITEA